MLAKFSLVQRLMRRLCQSATNNGNYHCTLEQRLAKYKEHCYCAAREFDREEKIMTWSKESIGNTAAVSEATPSNNGSRKLHGKYESIRRRRSSTKIAARSRSIESVKRKYSVRKKQQPTRQPHNSDSDAEQRDSERDSSPSSGSESLPRRRSQATVRRVHAFRRSSRHRVAFKEHGPRIVPDIDIQHATLPASQLRSVNSTKDPVGRETNPSRLAGNECVHLNEDPTLSSDGDICSLSAIQVSVLNEDSAREKLDHNLSGPDAVQLLVNAGENVDTEEEQDTDIGSQAVVQLHDEETAAIEKDLGPEPMTVFDTQDQDVAVTEGKPQESTEKRPSMLKRMLRRSTSLARRVSIKGYRRQIAASQARRRRARVPMKRILRRPRKVVVMGDMFSGKSNLISTYCHDRFSTNYIPTLLSTCLTDAKVFGEKIELVVVEVVGRDDCARLRKCAYHKMDTIILCYSVDSPESLERIIHYWMPELKSHAPKVPFILVATKKDIRDEALDNWSSSTTEKVVSTARGQKVADNIGAHTFLECSARYRDNTRNVFETAAKVALQKSRRKRK